ncbi:hypothetical protein [Streptosporangium saharense]
MAVPGKTVAVTATARRLPASVGFRISVIFQRVHTPTRRTGFSGRST